MSPVFATVQLNKECEMLANNLLFSGQPGDLCSGGTQRGALQELCATCSLAFSVCCLHPESSAATFSVATSRFVQHR